mmetsp:Transcript_17306/g.26782  ORF Transcript_17306/g.26782 Transcript_17306/m.26782 type:complete len:353 (+) Transcript_17306:2-1060(+)
MHTIFEKLIQAVVEEPEADVQLALCQALEEGFTNGGPGCLSDDKVKETIEAMKTVTVEVIDRHQKRSKAQDDEDFDDEEAENQEQEADRDDELLDQITTTLAALTKTHKQVMANLFPDLIFPFFCCKMVESPTPSHRRVGICILDEVLENLEELGQNFVPQVVRLLVNSCGDPSPEVRQAAVFGLGVCAQYGGGQFSQIAMDIAATIELMIAAPDARSEENVYATDNAVSALGKVIEFQIPDGEERNRLVGIFLSYLPVRGDQEEGIQVHGRLCSLLESKHALIMSAPETWFPHILRVFAVVFGTPAVNEEVTQRMKGILTEWQQSNPAISEGAFAALSPEDQASITALMQT